MIAPTIGALSIKGLSLARGGRTLFSGLDLTLSAGEACAITGANGAGKTSLLRAVCGFLSPVAGEIVFEGAEAAVARAEALHLLGHHDGLKPSRTAAEEFGFWARWCGAAPDAVADAVAILELKDLLPLEVRRLSAGQRRRLALGRLVAAPRPLWLLDEPASPLDARWRTVLGQIIERHLASGGMVLAAVHDPLPGGTRTQEIAA